MLEDETLSPFGMNIFEGSEEGTPKAWLRGRKAMKAIIPDRKPSANMISFSHILKDKLETRFKSAQNQNSTQFKLDYEQILQLNTDLKMKSLLNNSLVSKRILDLNGKRIKINERNKSNQFNKLQKIELFRQNQEIEDLQNFDQINKLIINYKDQMINDSLYSSNLEWIVYFFIKIMIQCFVSCKELSHSQYLFVN